MELLYPYIKSDPFTEKISYSYTQFNGIPFIEAWKKSRRGFCQLDNENLENLITALESSSDCATMDLFRNWISMLPVQEEFNQEGLLLLLKRFEVTKKIYGSYDENFRPVDKTDYKRGVLYLLFAVVLAVANEKSPKLQYLNALLKVNDIICSIHEAFNASEKKLVSWVLQEELRFGKLLESKLKPESIA